jgi:hypothetical protein
MGFIQALVDDVFPFPRQADYDFIGDKQIESVNRISFSFLNLIFQTIDCLIIPFVTFACFKGQIQFGWLNWIIIIVGGFSSVFSLFQFLYYFIFPAEKYLNPIKGRIFCETAIGHFVAALFKIKIITYVK